ncbi:winged helix-turn-helix transcriptional regulator [Dyadobacter luticola]|uniref:Helix-turn-helix transcriptional regulator n=1 Tax=Dyadobacter luticola TaxID=1979387 RepID=A0A5R9L169_9BACT|nr:helix-turn-helix domain-containing protein [Dyadobacter luticola]TLV02294.1 helix-turn-helix transcriptional regulator [Dyadobacter luticola]
MRKHQEDSKPTVVECNGKLAAMGDALYAIGGKWKLRVILALSEGNMRFNDLQRSISGISARVLSNELKELEMNGFVKRIVYTDPTVIIEYELTDYSDTLDPVLSSLINWGEMHRAKIRSDARAEAGVTARAVLQ